MDITAARKFTVKMLELGEGTEAWETIARACLAHMSEAEVADLWHRDGFCDDGDGCTCDDEADDADDSP
jgi:hypothetical protein